MGAASEDFRDVQVSLSAELARNYFELRGAQERLAVARKNAENQRRTLQVTQQRLDAGRGTAFDTERARTQLGFTLASIPDLEDQVASAQYQIGVLVGRPPARLAQELGAYTEIPALPTDVAVRAPIRSSGGGRTCRPRSARWPPSGRSSARPRRTTCHGSRVGGSAGYSAATFGGLGDDGTLRYAVGPIISWPALNLGRVKARVDASQARAAEAEAQYSQTVLRALQEVESSLSRYRTSRTRVERIGMPRRRARGRRTWPGFASKVAWPTFSRCWTPSGPSSTRRSQLAQAHTDAATAYAALFKALGGNRTEGAAGTR